MRLGEYDISTITDGKHKDIDIVHAVKHERYIKNTGVDEIAMIYLKKHVDFNGKREKSEFPMCAIEISISVLRYFFYKIESAQFVYQIRVSC